MQQRRDLRGAHGTQKSYFHSVVLIVRTLFEASMHKEYLHAFLDFPRAHIDFDGGMRTVTHVKPASGLS